ncbi:roadblock/LC7 domain-containing protein [Streptomyces sp. PSKA30]|uniref:roadblock/LC7 domain-containing protein n=1 Tax=Streptomyces sp. PSKA30 TaxID=2874597 RepID=UPI001CD161ED|nr:roadblock/LC7 domain-containing protein [Streptomyces sp. PSKA30]MBZ9645425.1 roadblock/LC7 domain-containing protein [Streptomyces sp. PSKA30]
MGDMNETGLELSAEAQNFNWLLNKFAAETPGVMDAIAVSSDGLLIGISGTRRRDEPDRLAAITSGIISLAGGAARGYELGSLNKVIVDMSDGYLVTSAISSGCMLGVISSKAASLGNIAYEMTLFANRVGEVLTPGLVHELKVSVQR